MSHSHWAPFCKPETTSDRRTVSPEPWSIHDFKYNCGQMHSQYVNDASGEIVQLHDHLERIVACVNFCRQFPTEFLQSRQIVNLKGSFGPGGGEQPNNLEYAATSLADVQRFCGLVAIQRNS